MKYYSATYTPPASSGGVGVCAGGPDPCPIQIGFDNTGTFVQTLFGLAIYRPDGRAVLYRDGQLADVTPAVLFGACAFRVPTIEVNPGDILVTSGTTPPSLLIVTEERDRLFEARRLGGLPREIHGLDPYTGNRVHYVAPRSLFPLPDYFVRVESLFGDEFGFPLGGALEWEGPPEGERWAGGRPEGSEFFGNLPLALLLLGCQAQNPLTFLLLIEALRGRAEGGH